jgi:hypothetical protein
MLYTITCPMFRVTNHEVLLNVPGRKGVEKRKGDIIYDANARSKQARKKV